MIYIGIAIFLLAIILHPPKESFIGMGSVPAPLTGKLRSHYRKAMRNTREEYDSYIKIVKESINYWLSFL